MRRLPLRVRLTAIGVVSSAVVGLIVCAAFAVNIISTFRQSLLTNLSVQAETLAFNAVTAVLFDDRDSAASTLAALRANPHVMTAAIYDAEGRVFAAYRRAGVGHEVPERMEPSRRAAFERERLFLTSAVSFNGEEIGMVAVESDLDEMNGLLRRVAATVAILFAATLVVGYAISARLERGISRPILDLAQVAIRVTGAKDYSVRVSRSETDEIGVLFRAFNEMLDQIQAREMELRRANDSLEQRVTARTHQLEAANKELEAFSYSVSHDLRAPLRGIAGFSDLARKHGALDPTLLRYLDKISSAAGRMGELIDHLLVFSRMGRTAMSLTTVDLSVLVDEIRRDLAADTKDRSIQWKIAPLPKVRGDATLLRQVVTNLVSNAVKYTRPRAEALIEIEAKPGERGEMVLSVKDNGVGFDMRFVDKLFGVFQRLHRTDEFEGTGIGLANVRRIVQRHGGRAWAEGAEGKGATFFISLPDDTEARHDAA